MFTSLHALAKQATLMITIAAEGDDLVRVNVAPVPADTKSKAKLPQPLSLLATPSEFDADFIAVLATWQAPKRTLLQQAQDAAGGAQAPAAMLPAPAAGSDSKAADKPQEKAKPVRKARGDKSAGAEQEPAGLQAAGEAAGAAGAAADEVMVSAAAAGAPVADGEPEKVDTRTLDMFVAPDPSSAPAPAPAPAPAGDAPAEGEDNQVAPLNDCF